VDAARADIEVARSRARQARSEAAAAWRTWIPRLDVMVGVMASTSNTGIGPGSGTGYVVGVGGELPVFSRGGPAVTRARSERLRWESEVVALTAEAQGEVIQARIALQLRIAQAIAYTAGPAQRALDLQRRATVAYREGDRPILELLDVHRTARLAAIRELELIYEARTAELAWHRAHGKAR
jgi:outer membrane protein TolC